jgi:hypothetical protein
VSGGRFRQPWTAGLLAWGLAVGLLLFPPVTAAVGPTTQPAGPGKTTVPVEILHHEWRPGEVWERIGKTQFFWSATVRNNSDRRQRVYVYYDLLDARGVPLARNVFNRFVPPHQTVEIAADSYILSVDLPKIRSSRARVKLGYLP